MRHMLIVIAMALTPVAANAATVNYEATINLNDPDYTIINVDGVQLFLPGIYSPGSDLIELNPGDSINGTVLFNGGRLQISDSGHGDYEIATFFPFISTNIDDATYSDINVMLLGVKGDYTGPANIMGNISGAVLGGYRIGDLTGSSFSFSGLQFTVNYQSGNATSFDPYVVAQFTRVDGAVLSSVPEASTWAMMLLGFGAMGTAMRRPRRRRARATTLAS